MPVDPRTGQSLPYEGEPGYEEAMAANPELYAEAGAPPPGGEMMPPGGEMMPPGGEMMPPDAGAPSPEDIEGLEQEEAMLQQDVMSQAAPMPEQPFSTKAIETLLSEFNNTIDAFAGEDVPNLEWAGSEGGNKWDQPLPPEVFAPLVALNESLKLIGEGEFFDKYSLDLEALTSDAELRKATATLKKMSKDKKLVEAMQAPVSPETEAGPEMAPAPGNFNEDEQMLAANMS